MEGDYREEILETESVVKERYGAGAQAVEAALSGGL